MCASDESPGALRDRRIVNCQTCVTTKRAQGSAAGDARLICRSILRVCRKMQEVRRQKALEAESIKNRVSNRKAGICE